MDIFPAIDLRNGQCVRLKKGDFADATIYKQDPVSQARLFADQGAKWLHVVDLDGAKDGSARQTEMISRIVKDSTLSVQVGGGVRSIDDINTLLECGVKRVVIGSLAADKPDLVQEWIERFGGDKIVLALDIRFDQNNQPIVLTRGWQDQSSKTLTDVLALYQNKGAKTVLCTDVERDGMLQGPNIDLYKRLGESFPDFDILASGGIASLDDIRALRTQGVSGAITGKALYENRFNLFDALNEAQNAC